MVSRLLFVEKLESRSSWECAWLTTGRQRTSGLRPFALLRSVMRLGWQIVNDLRKMLDQIMKDSRDFQDTDRLLLIVNDWQTAAISADRR